MSVPPKIFAASAAAVLTLAAASAVGATAAGATSHTSAQATAVFTQNLLGVSRFNQRDSTVQVKGRYRYLTPGNSYYTVVYGNTNCDPAQAFPVGFFTADSKGSARFRMSTTTTIPNLVAGTMSMSVRMADTAADLDGDGKTGPSDVVAVAGTPSIGLVECNSHPTVTTRR